MKTLRFLALCAAACIPSFGAITVVATSASNGLTSATAAVNTTGATGIIACAGPLNQFPTAGQATDNVGNTYTLLNTYPSTAGFVSIGCYKTTGTFTSSASHVVTISTGAFNGTTMLAYSSGVAGDLIVDQQQGNAAEGSGSPAQADAPVVPLFNNEIVISHLGFNTASGITSIDSGFSTPVVAPRNSTLGDAISYKIQTTAASVNPAWTMAGSSSIVTQMVSLRQPATASGFPVVY